MMIGIPLNAKNKITNAFKSRRAETLFITGNENKDEFIVEAAKNLKIKLVVLKDKVSTHDIEDAFYNYYYVYISKLNELGEAEQKVLCENLKKGTHATFLGGFEGYKKSHFDVLKNLKDCRKRSQFVHYMDALPAKTWTGFTLFSIFSIFLMICTPITCLICISKKSKGKLFRIERELNKESTETYHPRGVQFALNTMESIPSIDLYLYGGLGEKLVTAPVPLETTQFLVQQPQPYVQQPNQQGPVYYQIQEVQETPNSTLYPTLPRQFSYSTFPKQ
jgi:hypothetical protein